MAAEDAGTTTDAGPTHDGCYDACMADCSRLGNQKPLECQPFDHLPTYPDGFYKNPDGGAWSLPGVYSQTACNNWCGT